MPVLYWVLLVILICLVLLLYFHNPEEETSIENKIKVKVHHKRAGFFSILIHYLWAADFAEKNKKVLIADWSQCPYVDQKEKDQNSFNYYFTQNENNDNNIPVYTEFVKHQQEIPQQNLLFLWKKYVLNRLNESIKKEFRQLNKRWNFKTKKMTKIAVHGRFTDKFNGPRSFEHDHQHPLYEDVYFKMYNYIKKNKIYPYRVYVATDEQPFLDFLSIQKWPFYKKKHNSAIILSLPDAYRSSINTSGVTLNVTDCDQRPNDQDCQYYWKLPLESIHLGHPEWSNRKKGRDILLDGLMLAKSDIFFKSRGNISNLIEALLLQQKDKIIVDSCSFNPATIDSKI
jgi:hypothetical protein